jgi:hypothetical protein
MRPFNRDVDGIGTRVGINPRARGISGAESWDKILMGTVLNLDDDKLSPVDFDRGQPLEGRNFAYELNYVVFDNEDETNNVRPFNIEKDQLGSRVAITGFTLPDGNDSQKFYYGTIREIEGVTNADAYLGIEFYENINGHDLEGKTESGYGWRVDKSDVFILSQDFELNQPKGAGEGMAIALKSVLAELMLTNLSKTNSNRVNLVIEDLKSKIGEDWEEQVRNAIEPEAAAEIFISLIRELEKQEQERLQFGSVQTPSAPTKSRRGRPRKEKTPEPKPMPTTPEVDDVQSEEDLSALLDDLLNL